MVPFPAALERLAAIPALDLWSPPSPIHDLSRLGAALGGGPRLLVKRDDAIPFGFGGNKVRKIAIVAAAAIAEGADTLLSVGGVQSNSARVVAAVAARMGLQVRARAERRAARQAHRATRCSTGCSAPRCTTSSRARTGHRRWRGSRRTCGERGATRTRFPLGASTPLGALGFVRAVGELVQQGVVPDVIVHSTSSGGTQAGLVAGCTLHGLPTRVLGISADDPADAIRETVRTVIAGMGDLLGVRRHASSPMRGRSRSTTLTSATATACRRRRRAKRSTCWRARGDVRRSHLHGQGAGRADSPRAPRLVRRQSDRPVLAHGRAGGAFRMTTLTFLGAAADGDRLEVPARNRRPAHPRRLRALPGPQGRCASATGRRCPFDPKLHRRGGPDARAPRSLRLPAAARRQGFTGRVFCTPGTADLCRIVLPDAGRLPEEDARDANRGGYTKHAPALPLFTEDDALRRSTHLQPVGYDRPGAGRGAGTLSFADAGHLLGLGVRARSRSRPTAAATSSSAATSGATTVPCCRIRRRWRPPTSCSSNRPTATACTKPDDDGARLARDHQRRRSRGGGKVIIPAFAIGRVEEVIYWLKTARRRAPDPGGAGLRRQPDGGRGAEALREPQPRARPRHADGPAARWRALHHAAVHGGGVAAAVEGAPGVERRRRSSSRRAAWRRAGACCTT